MHRRLMQVSASLAAIGLLVGGLVFGLTRPDVVPGADAPWTTPTRPPACTETQRTSGDVASCVILMPAGLPESRGWPTPPFPEAVPGDEQPWVDLAKGSSGPVVAEVQKALNANGANLLVDGQFGTYTETAVKNYQSAKALPVTGIVDKATADRLGVKNVTYVFPPPGWTWLGWGYNGSVALAAWEKGLVSNATAIGSIKAGGFRAMPEAMPLFENFMREIQARGYVINGGAGGYVFRCTATTRKDCAGLSRSALSNHAYGLAADLNTLVNPLKRYYGIDGQTACQTPMETDMPQWVIQVAEKWGLYWGGYGWSSGCVSPTEVKTSAMRDPMHFEFNGTPEVARAILRRNLGSSACFPVADQTGAVFDYCLAKGEVPPAGTRLVVATGAPAGATAAMVNITTLGATAGGSLAAESCGASSSVPTWSSANVRPGRPAAETVAVPIDGQGRFCLRMSTAMHVIVDVKGYFAPSTVAPNGALYVPVTPTASVDTRRVPHCADDGTCYPSGPVAIGRRVLSMSATPLDPVASVATFTASGSTAAGHLTVDRCADLATATAHSSLNMIAGETVSNMVVTRAASTGLGSLFCTSGVIAAHQAVEVHGHFAVGAAGGLGYTQLATPSRVLDSKTCWTDPITGTQRCNQINAAGSVVRMRAPVGASAVMVRVAAVDAQAAGFATARSCAVTGVPMYGTVNTPAGVGSVANVAIVPVAPDGTWCIYVSSAMHLLVDLVGTFSTSGPLRFVPTVPTRVEDTRF